MTTNIDVANQALIALGRRTIITSFTQDSVEAKAINSIYNFIQDWSLSLANWNFARRTAVLTQNKAVVLPPTTWGLTSPSPPWTHEFALPTDFIKALYLTNNDPNGTVGYAGELKRFAIAASEDGLTRVLLTNETAANLVYIFRIIDPTLWPAYFERFMVAALAWQLAAVLEGDQRLVQYFDDLTARNFQIAEQINREEGLIFADTTPEWIQAVGINYPYRRQDGRVLMQQPQSRKQQRNPNDDNG